MVYRVLQRSPFKYDYITKITSLNNIIPSWHPRWKEGGGALNRLVHFKYLKWPQCKIKQAVDDTDKCRYYLGDTSLNSEITQESQ